MKQVIGLFLLLLAVMGAVAWLSKQGVGQLANLGQAAKPPSVVIGNTKIAVEVMDTPEKREQGLSGRESLEVGKGMLFKFSPRARASFWMKGMKFAIDMIWIRDGAIVKVDGNVPAPIPGTSDERLARYPSPGEIDFVLEVPAGYAKANGIKRGDKVTFENI